MTKLIAPLMLAAVLSVGGCSRNEELRQEVSLPSDDAIMATMNRMGSCNGAVALYGLVKQSDAVWQIYYRAGRSWKDDAKLLEAHNGKWFVHCVSGISQYLLEVEQNQAQPPSSGPS